ncbi:uncharacterized protein FMAN_15335 [Fusarium mangiferae]|uniref:Uncharacterized protein n=1 Tax=Fusarium mangiferae TaxID=192010 RepID=A0A1L7UI89_FUSMA|nr:uncharacterized protein FMAN_15335 [Fusarium mangiferae]CVL07221.1 uncharacterized protein FMAN_15335 [Fusarium mangiferae]
MSTYVGHNVREGVMASATEYVRQEWSRSITSLFQKCLFCLEHRVNVVGIDLEGFRASHKLIDGLFHILALITYVKCIGLGLSDDVGGLAPFNGNNDDKEDDGEDDDGGDHEGINTDHENSSENGDNGRFGVVAVLAHAAANFVREEKWDSCC